MPVQMPDESFVPQGAYPGALQQAAQPMIVPGYGGSDPQSMIMQALATMPRRSAPPSPATQALTTLSTTLLGDTNALPSALERAASTRDQATADKMAAIERAMSVLSGLGQPDPRDRQLALGAGFLAPTTTGQFSESLGNAASQMLKMRQGENSDARQNALDLSKLAMQKAGIPEDAAEQAVNDATRRMQLGMTAAQQATLGDYRSQMGDARAAAANRQHVKYLGASKDDPTQGLYLNQDTNEVTYGPLVAPNQRPLTPNEALKSAEHDFEVLYPKPEFDGPRVLPKEGVQKWIQKRAQAYARGEVAPEADQGTAAPSTPQRQQPAAKVTPSVGPASPAHAPRGGPPQRPTGVPQSAKFSPSQKKWYWQENGQWMAR